MDNLWITLPTIRQALLLAQVNQGFHLWTTLGVLLWVAATLGVCIMPCGGLAAL